VLRKPAVDAFERRRDHVDAEHHPRAAAVRLVVDLPAGERRPVAVVEEAKVELVAEHRRNGPLLRDGGKDLRHKGEDVNAQKSRQVSAPL
jgi:hypothetical protein